MSHQIPPLAELVELAKSLFRESFGGEAVVGGVAPGRVNLIGRLSSLT